MSIDNAVNSNPMESEEYKIVADDDGHYYVIPVDKGHEWYKFIMDIYHYWEPGSSHEGPEPKMPEWAEPVGGHYSNVLFKDWRIA